MRRIAFRFGRKRVRGHQRRPLLRRAHEAVALDLQGFARSRVSSRLSSAAAAPVGAREHGIAALQQRGDVREALALEQRPQVGHGDLVVAAHVDRTQEQRVARHQASRLVRGRGRAAEPRRGSRASTRACSGFITQARRQVTESASQFATAPDGSTMARGNVASARCRSSAAAAVEDRRGRGPRTRSRCAPARPTRRCPARAGQSGAKRASRDQRGVQRERRFAPRLEPARELAAALQRQQSLRRPERHRRGAGPRALERDLAQVQLGRTEVRVRRIVLVEAAHRRDRETARSRSRTAAARACADRSRSSPPRRCASNAARACGARLPASVK